MTRILMGMLTVMVAIGAAAGSAVACNDPDCPHDPKPPKPPKRFEMLR
jgi:hypothetical protein